MLSVQCDLDLEGMTFGQNPDTPLGQGQQLSGLLSESNITVGSYLPDKANTYDGHGDSSIPPNIVAGRGWLK